MFKVIKKIQKKNVLGVCSGVIIAHSEQGFVSYPVHTNKY